VCCLSCSRIQIGSLDAHVCLSWWVVFSHVVCCAACLVLEFKQVFSMRMCVWVGGVCSVLLFCVLLVLFSNSNKSSRCACVFELVGCVLSCCVVLRILFSNAYRSSRCACVCQLVGFVLSCCVVCCLSCSRMRKGHLDAHACLRWWFLLSLVVCCAACLVLECIQVLSMRMRVWVGGLCSLLLCVVLRVLFSNYIGRNL
jgi:uncharacterized membrane protein